MPGFKKNLNYQAPVDPRVVCTQATFADLGTLLDGNVAQATTGKQWMDAELEKIESLVLPLLSEAELKRATGILLHMLYDEQTRQRLFPQLVLILAANLRTAEESSVAIFKDSLANEATLHDHGDESIKEAFAMIRDQASPPVLDSAVYMVWAMKAENKAVYVGPFLAGLITRSGVSTLPTLMGHLELTSDTTQYTKRNLMNFFPATAGIPLSLTAKVPDQTKLSDCKTYFSPGRLPLASLLHRSLILMHEGGDLWAKYGGFLEFMFLKRLEWNGMFLPKIYLLAVRASGKNDGSLIKSMFTTGGLEHGFISLINIHNHVNRQHYRFLPYCRALDSAYHPEYSLKASRIVSTALMLVAGDCGEDIVGMANKINMPFAWNVETIKMIAAQGTNKAGVTIGGVPYNTVKQSGEHNRFIAPIGAPVPQVAAPVVHPSQAVAVNALAALQNAV